MTDNTKTLLASAAAVAVADQLTKAMVEAWMPGPRGPEVIPGLLDLVHVKNRGAAFGFLNRPDIDWQVWLFAAATVLAVGIIVNLVRNAPPRSRTLCTMLGMVLGGALSNMLDRIRMQAVTDFIDVHVGQYHWPAFNVADTAICCGAAVACIILWNHPNQDPSS